MMFQLLVGLIVSLRKYKCKNRNNKNFLLNVLKEKGLGIHQIFRAK